MNLYDTRYIWINPWLGSHSLLILSSFIVQGGSIFQRIILRSLQKNLLEIIVKLMFMDSVFKRDFFMHLLFQIFFWS